MTNAVYRGATILQEVDVAKWLHICEQHKSPYDEHDPFTFPAEPEANCTLVGCEEKAVISRMIRAGSSKKDKVRG